MTRLEIVSNFIDNLERERTALGLTQAQMAKKLEISVSTYKKLIAGETSKVDLYTAYRAHNFTGKWAFELCGCVSTELMQVASKLRRLTPSQLRFVAGVIDLELSFLGQLPVEIEDDYVNLLTPTGNLEDGMIWDSMNIEKLNIAPYRKLFGARLQCAMRITSDHLRPVYCDGDILLLSQSAPRDGDTGIFINKEKRQAYIRKFCQSDPCTLKPLNGYGLTFTLYNSDSDDSDKWVNFGQVLSKIRE